MTDLRYLSNHHEKEPRATWGELFLCVLVVCAVVGLLSIAWAVLPGAATVDDVLQITKQKNITVQQ